MEARESQAESTGHRAVPAISPLSDRAERYEDERSRRFKERLRSAQLKRVEKTGEEFRGLRALREEHDSESAFVEEPAVPVEVVPGGSSAVRWMLFAVLIALLLVLSVLL